MWQLRGGCSVWQRLHFGELNQLNGCGRAEREAGYVWRLKSSQENTLVSPAKAESVFFFLSFLCFIAEALTRHSLFLIFQSQFSLLSVLRSLSSTPFLLYLLVFSYFGQITLSSSAPTLMFISFFSITQLQTETDGQALRPRWKETGSHREI